MYSNTKIIKAALLGLGLFTLGACQHTSVGTAGLNQNVIRNSVQMVRLPLEIKREADATDSLSAHSKEAIRTFLASVNAGYGDVLMLDGPSASPARLAAVENLITRAGLAYGGTSALGAKPGNGAIMLYVERYIVDTPNCNYWPEEASGQTKNNDSSFHGCTTRINLGLMTADPRDLVSGRSGNTTTASAVKAILAPTPAATNTGKANGGSKGLKSGSSSGTSSSSK